LDKLPDTHEMYIETLEDLKNFDGQFIVKWVAWNFVQINLNLC